MNTSRNYELAAPDRYDLLKEYSRKNRTCLTDCELLLWERLRRKALGVKFRRQQCIGDYITDFACIDKKLIIEIDGEYHNTEQQRHDDNLRSEFFYKHNFFVLRFTNEMVMTDIEYVINRIKETIVSI